jgi:hypothetical protein
MSLRALSPKTNKKLRKGVKQRNPSISLNKAPD